MGNLAQPLILALDDERMNIKLLEHVLQKNGFKFLGTTAVDDFYHLLPTCSPDLILLDVMMPDITGFDVCQQLKLEKQYKEVPVIFLTGKTSVEDKLKGFESGGLDYIIKPFNEHELVARIRTHCNLKFAKAKIEVQAHRLKQSNALKDRIFSIIGHDLRSPLSAAKLKLDFIHRGLIDHTSHDFKNVIVSDLLRTMDESLDLLQNLLGWAKSESGQIKLFEEELDIHEIVTQILRLFQLASDQKKLSVFNRIQPGTLVKADLNTTKTILRNLISNAIKFTPKNGTIEIASGSENGRCYIHVRDTGKGIEKENISKVLNPKKYYSQPGTEDEPGTGLGLILCQDFARKNGGVLQVESKVGEGSDFYFDLLLA